MDFIVHKITVESDLIDLKYPGMQKASTEHCFNIKKNQQHDREKRLTPRFK